MLSISICTGLGSFPFSSCHAKFRISSTLFSRPSILFSGGFGNGIQKAACSCMIKPLVLVNAFSRSFHTASHARLSTRSFVSSAYPIMIIVPSFGAVSIRFHSSFIGPRISLTLRLPARSVGCIVCYAMDYFFSGICFFTSLLLDIKCIPFPKNTIYISLD